MPARKFPVRETKVREREVPNGTERPSSTAFRAYRGVLAELCTPTGPAVVLSENGLKREKFCRTLRRLSRKEEEKDYDESEISGARDIASNFSDIMNLGLLEDVFRNRKAGWDFLGRDVKDVLLEEMAKGSAEKLKEGDAGERENLDKAKSLLFADEDYESITVIQRALDKYK